MKLLIFVLAIVFLTGSLFASDSTNVEDKTLSEVSIVIGVLDVDNEHDDLLFSVGLFKTIHIKGAANIFINPEFNIGTGGYSGLYNLTLLFGYRYAPPKGVGLCYDFGTGIGTMNSNENKKDFKVGLCGKLRIGYEFSKFGIYFGAAVYNAKNTS
ncbi:MAG: hypothetical protein PF588_07580, partial [Candidatus Kapabacteria bacterium]|nr:hypothetical protein [Candidatus Kapabacteria bacterium]